MWMLFIVLSVLALLAGGTYFLTDSLLLMMAVSGLVLVVGGYAGKKWR